MKRNERKGKKIEIKWKHIGRGRNSCKKGKKSGEIVIDHAMDVVN